MSSSSSLAAKLLSFVLRFYDDDFMMVTSYGNFKGMIFANDEN